MARQRFARVCAVLSLVLASAPWGLGAAPVVPLSDYTITTWTRRDGMVASPIWAIAQDKNGYLWLGTGDGLVRFDGVRFVGGAASGLDGLPRDTVLGLLSSRDGSLWLGFNGAGIARLRDGRLTMFTNPASLGHIRTLVEDRGGRIWAGGRGGLYRFNGEAWEHQGGEVGLPEGPNNGAHVDEDGALWVATGKGIFRRAVGSEAFARAETQPALFARLTPLRNAFRVRTAGRDPRLFGAMEDRRGSVWVPTLDEGVWTQRGRPDGRVTLEHITKQTGLASDVVGAVFEDADENIWIGTQSGLHKLTRRHVSSLDDVGTANTIHASADGSVWIGTDQGLIRLQGGRRRVYTERDGLASRKILAIASDPREGVWVATNDSLARFTGGRFDSFVLPPDKRFIRLMSMAIDSRGTVWLNDLYRGVWLWSRGHLTSPEFLEPLNKQTSVFLFHAHDDRIWTGLADGRLAAVSGDGQVATYDNVALRGGISAITEDPSGVLWVAGADGIARFDNGKSVAATSRTNGFPAAGVVSILTEPEAIWAGTRSGIVRIDRREFDRLAAAPQHKVEYKLYDDADGLQDMPIKMAFPSAARTVDNKLWFLTDGGATIVDPAALPQSRRSPRVYVEEVRAGSQRFVGTSAFTLPSRNSRLEIDYTTPTFSSPQSVRFRYRLDGFDAEWQDVGSRRQAIYTSLPPGDFRFQVVAIDKEGHTGTANALAFRIAPAFYQTFWFYAACVLAVLLAGTAAWRLRLRSVRQRYALVFAERTRVGRDVHDTLLQSLVAVAVETGAIAQQLKSPEGFEVRKQLMRLREDVEEQIREMRQSIWKLRSPVLDREDLATALRRAGERLTQHAPARFKFAVTGRVDRCSSAVEEQLLRIGQEAVTNAVRHASATEISLELRYAKDTITLRVCDDGIGFEPAAIPDSELHLGLIGMHERAEQVGGRVSVSSSHGRGTDVVATFPISEETAVA